jgi:hypothetical protein
MAAFLLWNVNRRPLDGLVQDLVRQHGIDLVLLVEFAFGKSQLSGMLRVDGLVKRGSTRRFGVFSRVTHRVQLLRYRLGHRVKFWRWTSTTGHRGLIVLLHGLDRRNYDDSTRRVFFRRIADAVRRDEESKGHTHTIIAGDFNAHPFESSIMASDGLHALGVRSVKDRVTRAVRESGTTTDFFYNPMWRVYGHREHPDAGAATHHWTGAWAQELGWHMLDQVVLRPGEAPRFPEERLQIVSEIGGISLLDDQGLPDRETASDHLPVIFHWDL